jgi:hypothetical protein
MIYLISDFPMNAGSRALGAYRIATALRQKGHQVEVLDFSIVWSPQEIIEYIDAGPAPTWIGFSTTFSAPKTGGRAATEMSDVNDMLTRWDKEWDRKFFNEMKKRCPVLIGGARSTRLKYFYDADYFFTGYADQAVLDLTDYILGNTQELKTTTEVIKPLSNYFTDPYNVDIINCQDDYPVHTVDNITTEFVDEDFIQPGEVLPIEISRGCIFKCAFCAFPLNGKAKNDYIRPEDQLIEDITRYQTKYQSYNYLLMDDTFNDTVEKMEMMVRVQQAVPEPFNFWTYGRLDLLASKPEMIDLIGPSGWRYFSFGVETFNKVAGAKVGKGGNIDKQKAALATIKERYPEAWFLLEMIIGLPGDTDITIIESLNWLLQNPTLWDELNFKGLGINKPEYYTWTSDISKNPGKYNITLKNVIETASKPQYAWKHETMDGWEVNPLLDYINAKLAETAKRYTPVIPGRQKYLHHQADMIGLTDEIVRKHYNGKFSVAWFLTTYNMYHNYKLQKLATRGIKCRVNRLTDKDHLPKEYAGEQYFPLPIKKATLL